MLKGHTAMSAKNQKLRVIKQNLYLDLILAGLAVLSIAMLVYEFSVELSEEQRSLIHTLDFAISLIFLSDFMLGMYIAERKLLYFRQNWIDLLASIPVSDGVFRSFRALRLLRLLKTVRVIVRMKKAASAADRIIDISAKYVYATVITFIIILSGAVAFFTMEFGINPDVTNFFDAIWWSVVTATTVGYGDIYPVTWEGRIIGMLLMFFGIGLLGTIAGFVSGYITERRCQEND